MAATPRAERLRIGPMLKWLRSLFAGPPPRKDPVALARAAVAAGRLDEAERLLREARSLRPGASAGIAVSLAQVLEAQGKADEAKALLDEAAASGARDALGAIVEMTLARDGPRAAFARARALAPRLNVQEHQRRLWLLNWARECYWAAPDAEDPLQLELHRAAAAVPELALVGEATAPTDGLETLPADRQGPDLLGRLATLEARRAALHAVVPPRVEIGGTTRRLADACPFTHASLELFDLHGGVSFLPFAAIATVRWEPLEGLLKAQVTRRDGREIKALSALFYRGIERRPDLLRGMTVWNTAHGATRLPLGVRDYHALDDAGATTGIVSPVRLLDKAWTFEPA
jgi:hypothetical protein